MPAHDPAPSTRPAWQAALDEARLAGEHLDRGTANPPDSPAEVVAHLRLAWGHIAAELGSSDDTEAVRALAERLHAPSLPGEGLARRLVFAEPGGEEALRLLAVPELRPALERELAAVRHAAEELAARRDGSAVTGLGLVLAVALLLVFAPYVPDLGSPIEAPWRGLYYDNDRFEGPATERFDLDLDLDFGEKAPIRGMPRDGFSVRWDSCLNLDAPTEVRFELTSDDGSRLYVDGARLIDNWGEHRTETRRASTTLTAGAHHLMVEYYDVRHRANVALAAALGGEQADTIPIDVLSRPSAGGDPCPESP